MTNKKPLWEGHRERLRRRMEQEGWDTLKPYEMVELVLYHAVPRQDLSDISRALVGRFGSVGGVFCAPRERLMEVEGITPTIVEWILTTGELMRAYYDLHAQRGIRMKTWLEVRAFLEPRVLEAGDAWLWVLYSDYAFNLITFTDLRTSKKWWDSENVRQIVMETVNTSAKYVYFVLFFEDETPDMEESEKKKLENIALTLRSVEVDLVDCVLVGGGVLHSMNFEGNMLHINDDSEQQALHETYASLDVGGQKNTGHAS